MRNQRRDPQERAERKPETMRKQDMRTAVRLTKEAQTNAQDAAFARAYAANRAIAR